MPRTNPARYFDELRATRTKKEAARLFGCSEAQVGKMMDQRVLGFVQIGNRRQPTVTSIEKKLGRPIHELEAPLRDAKRSEGRRRTATVEAVTTT